ncbi:MAG: serine hydrolase domain-containing protein [Henriciella sp.]|nr:serine hydrolase domain-containing protein [Henriciella sp.]
MIRTPFSPTRRSVLAALPAGLLVGGCSRPASTQDDLLLRLIKGPSDARASAAGFVLMRGGEVLAERAVGLARGLSEEEKARGLAEAPFTTELPFRCASISKIAVAMTALELARQNVLGLDSDIAPYLPVELRHPLYPDAALTLRMLLSHTSGLRDPDAYWVAHPGMIASVLTPDLFAEARAPGSWFEYCNLNYGIAATVMEAASEERFDRLVKRLVLEPLGLRGNFNWSDVDTAYKQTGATLYRETEAGWQVQIDGPDLLSDPDPLFLKEEGADLSTYRPGQNGSLFSPQGGLRASLRDLALLAGKLKDLPELTDPVWTLNEAMDNGLHDQRYFQAFGTGTQPHFAAESLWPEEDMVGHHGEAYGLYAGAFYLPGKDLSLAYAVTGTPETPPARSPEHPSLDLFTAELVRAARQAYEAASAS